MRSGTGSGVSPTLVGPLFRITAITLDDHEAVSTVTAIASGDCLELIRTVSPRARITSSTPAKITFLLPDLLELHRAVGSVGDDDHPWFAGSHLIYRSLHKIVNGFIQG